MVFEARYGVMSKNLVPPILACNQCGNVMVPKLGETKLLCKCGKVYTLMAEGKPIQHWPER